MATQVLKRNYSLFRSAEDGNVYLFLGSKWYNMADPYSIGKKEIPGGYKECTFLGTIAGKGDELATMIEVAKEIAREDYSETIPLHEFQRYIVSTSPLVKRDKWDKLDKLVEDFILQYEDSFDV